MLTRTSWRALLRAQRFGFGGFAGTARSALADAPGTVRSVLSATGLFPTALAPPFAALRATCPVAQPAASAAAKTATAPTHFATVRTSTQSARWAPTLAGFDQAPPRRCSTVQPPGDAFTHRNETAPLVPQPA